ncbi:hypothetical protein LTR37_009532 [Vermiconidia calcicola]|uniref:Uncharacterized protein n=1 Tax=Vermiconidia calcicola TaxID=1690605 RepID=A0ACC3N905_9PEZI|nr:hypothetical protein LTR37_009532 [Vermiconidia calcicola]
MGDKAKRAEHRSKAGGDGSGGSKPPSRTGSTDAYERKTYRDKSSIDPRGQGGQGSTTGSTTGPNNPRTHEDMGMSTLPLNPNVPDPPGRETPPLLGRQTMKQEVPGHGTPTGEDRDILWAENENLMLPISGWPDSRDKYPGSIFPMPRGGWSGSEKTDLFASVKDFVIDHQTGLKGEELLVPGGFAECLWAERQRDKIRHWNMFKVPQGTKKGFENPKEGAAVGASGQQPEADNRRRKGRVAEVEVEGNATGAQKRSYSTDSSDKSMQRVELNTATSQLHSTIKHEHPLAYRISILSGTSVDSSQQDFVAMPSDHPKDKKKKETESEKGQAKAVPTAPVVQSAPPDAGEWTFKPASRNPSPYGSSGQIGTPQDPDRDFLVPDEPGKEGKFGNPWGPLKHSLNLYTGPPFPEPKRGFEGDEEIDFTESFEDFAHEEMPDMDARDAWEQRKKAKVAYWTKNNAIPGTALYDAVRGVVKGDKYATHGNTWGGQTMAFPIDIEKIAAEIARREVSEATGGKEWKSKSGLVMASGRWLAAKPDPKDPKAAEVKKQVAEQQQQKPAGGKESSASSNKSESGLVMAGRPAPKPDQKVPKEAEVKKQVVGQQQQNKPAASGSGNQRGGGGTSGGQGKKKA